MKVKELIQKLQNIKDQETTVMVLYFSEYEGAHYIPVKSCSEDPNRNFYTFVVDDRDKDEDENFSSGNK